MTTGTILIIAFICAALGYLAGLIITRMNTNQPKLENPPPLQQEESAQHPKFVVNHLDITLWSKTPEGLLLADVFGKTFASPRELSETEKNKLQKDLQTIQAWVGSTISIKEESKPVMVPQTTEVQSDQTEETMTTNQASEVPQPVVEQSSMEPITENPVAHEDLLAVSEDEAIKSMFTPKVEPVKPVPAKLDLGSKPRPAPPAPKSLVEQIDEVLQEKVARSAFAESGIKITANPQGGVEVWIGKQVFNGVDVVPEGAEKQLILQAIREWEKK